MNNIFKESTGKDSAKSRGYLYVTVIFALLAAGVGAMLLYYWNGVVEPKLRGQAMVHAKFLSQSQVGLISATLQLQLDEEIIIEVVESAIESTLLFIDPVSESHFFESISLEVDYDTVNLSAGSLDIKRGAKVCQGCIPVDVPVYSDSSDELLAVVHFEVSGGFFESLIKDVREKLIIEAMVIYILLFIVWLIMLKLIGKLQLQISERLKVEEELRQSEQRFKQIANSSYEGIIIHDDGLILDANERSAVLFGFGSEPLVGKVITDLMPPESRSKVTAQLLARNDEPFEAISRRKDGTEFHMEVRGRDMVYEGHDARVFVFRDITERKRAEFEIKEYARKLEKSNEELSDFAFTASHDLREPLRKIHAYSDLLAEELKEKVSDEEREYLDSIQRAVGRMQNLINALLSYSRISTSTEPFVNTDLTVAADEAVDDLQVLLEEACGIVEIKDMPVIEADPIQIRQLLFNLIGNSLKYRKKDRPPVVRISAIIEETTHDGPKESQCVLQIQDNGIGFEQKYHDRIFTIFKRLHGRGEYEGTGIGLALCSKIVRRHGGAISAEGELGVGSTFKVTLPLKQPRET